MRKNFWNRRMPSLFGIILITIAVFFTSFVVKSPTDFLGRASPLEIPENIRISNITDSSFTISYLTKGKVFGSISYGQNGQQYDASTVDDRDQKSGTLKPYNIHYFTIRELTPQTKYYFSITSGQTSYLNQNKSFTVTTGPKIPTEPPDQQPVLGKVIEPDGNNPGEGVIYLTILEGQLISALLKPDGTYILPLNSIRNSNLNSYFSFSNNTLEIMALGTKDQSQVKIALDKANPIPLITLSKNYDFTLDSLPVASFSGTLGFPSFFASESARTLEILTPKKEEAFMDQKPLFKGTALPESSIKITIRSLENIQTQIKADVNGFWSFRPKVSLSPGEHTIFVQSSDKNGILKTITQSFTVYAQGNQVDQSATPSATPVIFMPTITPTSTPTPSPIPSLSPTPIPSPTPIAIYIQSPTPTITNLPKKVLPQAGSSDFLPPVLTGIGTAMLGIIIFLLTQGKTHL